MGIINQSKEYSSFPQTLIINFSSLLANSWSSQPETLQNHLKRNFWTLNFNHFSKSFWKSKEGRIGIRSSKINVGRRRDTFEGCDWV